MRRSAKRSLMALASIAAALLVTVVAVQAVLQWRLTELLRRHLLPVLESKLGVELTLGDARINLPRGAVNLAGVELGQPTGFGDARMLVVDAARLRVGGMRLLTGDIFAIREASFHGARLSLVRDADGDLNVVAVSEHVRQPVDAAVPAADAPPAEIVAADRRPAPPEPTVIPGVRIGRLTMPLRLRFTDTKIRPAEPLVMALDLRIEGAGITTFESPDAPWGTVAITGSHADHPERGTIELQGSLAPLTDPTRPSFVLGGTIESVDPDWVMPYLDAGDVRCASLDLDVDLVCDDGVFDADRSVLTLRLHDVRLVGKLAERTPSPFRSLPELVLPIPVSGPLQHPELNWTYALVSALNEAYRRQSDEALLQGAIETVTGILEQVGVGTNGVAEGVKSIDLDGILSEKQKRRVSRFLEKLDAK